MSNLIWIILINKIIKLLQRILISMTNPLRQKSSRNSLGNVTNNSWSRSWSKSTQDWVIEVIKLRDSRQRSKHFTIITIKFKTVPLPSRPVFAKKPLKIDNIIFLMEGKSTQKRWDWVWLQSRANHQSEIVAKSK